VTLISTSGNGDISETDKEYVIRAELPAVKKEDVQVTLDAGLITIKGERKQQKEVTVMAMRGWSTLCRRSRFTVRSARPLNPEARDS
jgi:HSP20 family molecular chaperone IbpA